VTRITQVISPTATFYTDETDTGRVKHREVRGKTAVGSARQPEDGSQDDAKRRARAAGTDRRADTRSCTRPNTMSGEEIHLMEITLW
ncbi:hypothetical protein BaRGS_00019006, partial [Batillaria attramentaria]